MNTEKLLDPPAYVICVLDISQTVNRLTFYLLNKDANSMSDQVSVFEIL